MSIDLSLDRLRLLITHFPPYTRPTIHISGTNGKGSISALITSVLSHSDPPLRVGRFNSPHLVSIHDCITLGGLTVDHGVFTTTREEVHEADEEHGANLSHFELLTLTALRIFEQAGVDVVVLEVGMGGRLDATNVVDDETILVSALSAVDLDHQAFLGNTISLIAKEKAGIARKGKILVLGRQVHGEVESVVSAVVGGVGGVLEPALAVKARDWDETLDGPRAPAFSLFRSPIDFIKPAPRPVQVLLPCFPEPLHALLPLHGDYQLDNLGTALGVISALLVHYSSVFGGRITPTAVSLGVSSVLWPGRLSFHTISLPRSRPLTILVDGAHNPASAATLHEYIQHLISLCSLSPFSSPSSRSPPRRKLRLTYLLALSYSPQKTPLQTLSALLPPTVPANTDIEVNTSVLAMCFTLPEGMPWVKPVPPQEITEAARALAPDAQVNVVDGERMREVLQSIGRRAEERKEQEGGDQGELVVLAGSLYLVADFYRLLETMSCGGDGSLRETM